MTEAIDSYPDVSCALANCAYLCAHSVNAKPATGCCCLVTLIDHFIRNALESERARVAAEEAGQWDRAFGAAVPSDRELRNRRIIQIVSARALLASMNKPP
jgi:hypothetical protein